MGAERLRFHWELDFKIAFFDFMLEEIETESDEKCEKQAPQARFASFGPVAQVVMSRFVKNLDAVTIH